MIALATSCVTLIGMTLIARKRWQGWLVALANQALWLALIVQTRAYGLLVLVVALVVIYTRALLSWRADERAARSNT